MAYVNFSRKSSLVTNVLILFPQQFLFVFCFVRQVLCDNVDCLMHCSFAYLHCNVKVTIDAILWWWWWKILPHKSTYSIHAVYRQTQCMKNDEKKKWRTFSVHQCVANRESNAYDNKNNRSMKCLRQSGKSVYFNVKCLVRDNWNMGRQWETSFYRDVVNV